jgi:hypothetical protein
MLDASVTPSASAISARNSPSAYGGLKAQQLRTSATAALNRGRRLLSLRVFSRPHFLWTSERR